MLLLLTASLAALGEVAKIGHTVEVSPNKAKNKAFRMTEGSAACDLYLTPKSPWTIRDSKIVESDDRTLWKRLNKAHYFILPYDFGGHEYVKIEGDLYKQGNGKGPGKPDLPWFSVTVPKVDLQWDEKHGDAAKEEKEDETPAVLVVTESKNVFGKLIIKAPKDDFSLVERRVTLTWSNPGAVKVLDGEREVKSGVAYVFKPNGKTEKMLDVSAVKPGEVKFTLEGEPDNVNGERAVDYVHACCVKIELVTPDGDPVYSPVDSGDGQNEFTFSSANPGVLTMNLKAKVTPAQAADKVAKDCVFSVDPIGESTMKWANNNPGGKAVADNGFLKATVTFTGLPAKNSDFGKKVAKITCNGQIYDRNEYEVFFPRDSFNNKVSEPNWFYYWKQLTPDNSLIYNGSSGSVLTSEVQGMTAWSYLDTPDKTNIYVYDEVVCDDRPYKVGRRLSGIDMFIGAIIHENKHIQQIKIADAIVPSSGNDAFRHGWSWGKNSTHNHWGKGPDMAWGVKSVDDDGNGVVDDAVIRYPFEPGHGDDTLMEHRQYSDWPVIWILPSPMFENIHPIECAAINATDNGVIENDHADEDWASPGKQHQSIYDWSD